MLVRLRKDLEVGKVYGGFGFHKEMKFDGLKKIVEKTHWNKKVHYGIEAMGVGNQNFGYTEEMFDYITVEVTNVDCECKYDVVFPDTVELKFVNKENIMAELESQSEIDYNDYAEVKVYDVEWEIQDVERETQKMKTIQEIKEWLLENAIDENGDLAIRDLDLSDFDGDVVLEGFKVKGDLFQSGHEVDGYLCQGGHRVNGNLYQSNQEVKGILWQVDQEVAGLLYQDEMMGPPEISERAKSVLGGLESKYLEYYLAKNKDGTVYLYDDWPELHEVSWKIRSWKTYNITMFLKEPLADYDWKNKPVKVKELVK